MKLRTRLLIDYYFGGFLHAVLRVPTIALGKLLKRDHELGPVKEIAVLKLLGGGSLVIAYPALLALRRLPHIERLTLITSEAIAPFGESLGIFDEIVVVRVEKGLVTLGLDSLAAFRRLFRHDAIVDLEIHSRLSTVFSLLTAARNRVGFFTTFSFWRRYLNTHLLFCNITNGIYSFYDQIAMIFGATPVDLRECAEEFRRSLGPAQAFDTPAYRIALAPTCSGLSRERMLRPEDWPGLIAKRIEGLEATQPVALHMLGAPADRPELETMKGLLTERFGDRVSIHNHAGETKLKDSVRILAAMNEALCVDSALLHFNRLLGQRTVSFWGPTDPRTLLRGTDRGIDEIHYTKIPCSPCVHLSAQPPCKGQNICMRLALDPNAPLPRNQPWVLKT